MPRKKSGGEVFVEPPAPAVPEQFPSPVVDMPSEEMKEKAIAYNAKSSDAFLFVPPDIGFNT